MLRLFRSRIVLVVAATVGASVAGVTISATSHDPNVIPACVNGQKGFVRTVSDATDCIPDGRPETPIEWGITGPAGTPNTASVSLQVFSTDDSDEVWIRGDSSPCTFAAEAGFPGGCYAVLLIGSTVTLKAYPNGGPAPTWRGDCAGAVGTECTLTMDRNKFVTADFGAWGT